MTADAVAQRAWQRWGRGAMMAAGWLALLLAATTVFIVWYIGRERFIYYWDFVHYQLTYQKLAGTLRVSAMGAVRSVVTSVRWDDYSDLPIAPLTPVAVLFGDGRLAYVLSISILYALPTILITAALARELAQVRVIGGSDARDFTKWVLPTAVVALCPQFWVPVLRGFPDVVGSATLTFGIMLYLRAPVTRRQFRSAIALGALLGFTVLLRRWYAYSIIGFFVAVGARELLLLWPVWRRERAVAIRDAKHGIVYVTLAGVVAVAIVFLVAWPSAVRMLTTDYRDVYSAYWTPQTAIQQLHTLADYFGVLWLAAVLIALVAVARTGRRDIAVFLGIDIVVTYAMFRRTQDFGMQHYYPLLIPALALIGLALINAVNRIRSTPSRVALVAGVILASVLNFLVVLDPSVGASVPGTAMLLPSRRGYPLRRNDLPALVQLLNRIDTLVGSSDDSVYVLSSALGFSDATLRNAPMTLGKSVARPAGRILGTTHIDKRDGFPTAFFRAQYVIVTDPIGYHRPPSGQQVIGLLASQLLTNRRIGRAFRKLPGSVRLESGREVYIYQKERQLEAADVEALATKLAKAHPRHSARFAVTPEFVQAAVDAPPASRVHVQIAPN
ncbi:MAG: hypothetical protein ACR2MQ_14270 [Gemmatimonadaceae bacterium]